MKTKKTMVIISAVHLALWVLLFTVSAVLFVYICRTLTLHTGSKLMDISGIFMLFALTGIPGIFSALKLFLSMRTVLLKPVIDTKIINISVLSFSGLSTALFYLQLFTVHFTGEVFFRSDDDNIFLPGIIWIVCEVCSWILLGVYEIMDDATEGKRRTQVRKFLSLLTVLVIIGASSVYGIYKYKHRYDAENYVGRSAEEIIKRYGEFDRRTFRDSDGGYLTGTYIAKPRRVGFLGTYEEEYLLISFDENGIAYEAVYELGGKGG